jgi:cytochrome c553
MVPLQDVKIVDWTNSFVRFEVQLMERFACHESIFRRMAVGMDYHPRQNAGYDYPGHRWLRKKAAIFFAGIFIAAPAWAQQVAPEAISGCVPCHGADGIARYGEVPILAGQNAPYLLNQLHAFQSGKRPHKEMRYMTRNLTEEEMEAIAAYFSSLPPR